jgi:SNF2 family DNA or RNA helicase
LGEERGPDGRVVIVDEAHRLKEPKGQLALAMKSIDCRICFGLTGTLVQNRMEEMWSVLDFVSERSCPTYIQVDRGMAGTLRQWRDFAVNPIKRGHRHEGTADVVVMAIVSAMCTWS